YLLRHANGWSTASYGSTVLLEYIDLRRDPNDVNKSAVKNQLTIIDDNVVDNELIL
ncbi:23973_t:CDS:2, partial [Racocetra persica]